MKLIYVLLLLFLFGCVPKSEYGETRRVDGYRIVEVDSCEYIATSVYSGEVLTHKGNCKHCLQTRTPLN